MFIAIIAALCMVVQDSLAALKYQAAARNKGVTAALADVITWLMSITSTTIAAFTLHGHSIANKIEVIAFISAANIIGNLLGIRLGKKFIKDEDNIAQDKRLADVESRLKALENDTITTKESPEK